VSDLLFGPKDEILWRLSSSLKKYRKKGPGLKDGDPMCCRSFIAGKRENQKRSAAGGGNASPGALNIQNGNKWTQRIIRGGK